MNGEKTCLKKTWATTYCGKGTKEADNVTGCFFVFESRVHRCPECMAAKMEEIDAPKRWDSEGVF
jgi:hypothetical protein